MNIEWHRGLPQHLNWHLQKQKQIYMLINAQAQYKWKNNIVQGHHPRQFFMGAKSFIKTPLPLPKLETKFSPNLNLSGLCEHAIWYTSTKLTWSWPLCMNKLLRYYHWIYSFSWLIVCNRNVSSNYGNKRIGTIARRSVITQWSCTFHGSRVVSQNSSRYVNCGFESWSTLLFYFIFLCFHVKEMHIKTKHVSSHFCWKCNDWQLLDAWS